MKKIYSFRWILFVFFCMMVYFRLTKGECQTKKQFIEKRIQILTDSLKEKNNIIQTQELIIKENQQQIIKKDHNLCFYKKKIKLLTKEKEEIKKDLSSITNALIEKANEIEELNNLFS
ncbi:hypothetical protein [Italian clover phyllody phytoplasma]|uniref:hypothetical protein n=1 Tax=Italian clover phyllody phytoplasma TaxID=1196420 RepID=UPI000373EF1E|nr:hypothetical protein [Italian clover phyllody phytoplasma]